MAIGSINSFAQTTTITEMTNSIQDTAFAEKLKQAMNTSEDEELKEACEQMESYMLSMIYKQMKNSIDTEDSLIPKGDYESMFEDYLVDAQVDNMVKAGGVGLADMMYKQLTTPTVTPDVATQYVQYNQSI